MDTFKWGFHNTAAHINDTICVIHFIYYTFTFVYWSFSRYFRYLLEDEWFLNNSVSDEHAVWVMFVFRAWSLLPGVCFSFDRGSATEEELLCAFPLHWNLATSCWCLKGCLNFIPGVIWFIPIFRFPVIAWVLPVKRWPPFVSSLSRIFGLLSSPPGEV